MLRPSTTIACRSAARASSRSPSVKAFAVVQQQQQQQQPRPAAAVSSSRAAAAAAKAASVLVAAAVLLSPAAFAEEEQLPDPLFPGFNDPQKAKLKAAEETFQGSDTLKKLLEKSEANKAANKRAIQNKYCARQAELGIGDCGGLRFIPGMTKSGKQVTPEIIQKMLGVEGKIPRMEGEGKTLADLLGPEAAQE